MTTYNVALIGFGGVNQALAELVATRNEAWERELGFRLRIVAVSDLRFGSVVSPDGLDPKVIIESKFAQVGFGELSGGSSQAENEKIIKSAPPDIIVEATFTNSQDGEPAATHCRWAINAGKHVVTTNKGAVALAAGELKTLAKNQGVKFEYEGAVMSGTPIMRMAKKMLIGDQISGFEGILNGTSNFVLGRMESGIDRFSAVKEAQVLGYAEADPTSDIEGNDIRLKVVILANELLGANLKPKDVACEGISRLSLNEIVAALKENSRWKLIGSAIRDKDGSVVANVSPKRLPLGHPLAAVAGRINAVSLNTELLGPVTISGPGAGRTETAYALLSDIITIHSDNLARAG
ncbi:homoserine dehydrogenase [Bradyrhizobium sp. NAS96.2]|uniref:homoserine dehydrogenase n=1 Tax=Bradyrhizobium sp. NAS96.2 TaxID=1680160 RepID=UPI00093BC3E8|nr:homoserine dehydrogenase [Bradyrhizobium sp. NAS96.2]OKO84253.1 homoserine dehydrogenase [Bradyrhizobium sp. NAS96.2]